MRKSKYLARTWFGSIILISFFISGCSSLQIDVTPPPADTQAEQIPATPRPTRTPAPEVSQSAATLSPDELGSDVIVVTVVDQTGGVLLEQGLEVELAGYEEYELVYEDAEVLTSDARVIFEDAPFSEGRVYFASVSYGGAIYRSEIVELGADTTFLELTIRIYETTTSDESLVIDRVHLLADFPSPDYVQFVEIYIVSNLGDATVVSANPGEATISFPLPADAESVEFEDGALGQRYLQTEDGFGDTVGIPPGSGVYQVLVYYQLPVRRNRLDFSQDMRYPVQAVIAMVPAGEAVLKGSTLEDRGIQAIPDGSVQMYAGAAMERGDSLEFRLSIESSSNTLPNDGSGFLSQGVLIGAGVLGAVVFVIGGWLFLRQRRENLELDGDSNTSDAREQIMDSIIALEDLFMNGEIEEKAYLKKRQELRDKLKALAGG
ncbi:MAG: hypothetical protein DRI46_03495 [Chloroflexi bacterium]|nr:MAG: hypothetical protein DRI46_03495 [Chloroflexota bacterium]